MVSFPRRGLIFLWICSYAICLTNSNFDIIRSAAAEISPDVAENENCHITTSDYADEKHQCHRASPSDPVDGVAEMKTRKKQKKKKQQRRKAEDNNSKHASRKLAQQKNSATTPSPTIAATTVATTPPPTPAPGTVGRSGGNEAMCAVLGQNLTYSIGGPVLCNPQVHIIFYGKWNSARQSLVTNFISDLGTTEWFKVLKLNYYYQASQTAPRQYLEGVRLGKVIQPTTNYSTIITDSDLKQLLAKQQGSTEDIYLILTSEDVVYSDDVNEGNINLNRNSPSGDSAIDGLFATLAHEFAETITDPVIQTSWTSPDKTYEVSDCCEGVYTVHADPPKNEIITTSGGVAYNTLGQGGRRYLLPATFNMVGGGFCVVRNDTIGSLLTTYSLPSKPTVLTIQKGVVTTLAGGSYGTADGPRLNAQFTWPGALAVGSNLYIADIMGTIRILNWQTGNVTSMPGLINFMTSIIPCISPPYSFTAPNPQCVFNPTSLALDSQGENLYWAENSHRIKKISLATYIVTLVAGSGEDGGANGVGTAASFSQPSGLAMDSDDKILYVSDYTGHRIRKIDISSGTTTTIAGNIKYAIVGNKNDKEGSKATFNYPFGIALDNARKCLYVADSGNHLIRKVEIVAPYSVSTVAGSGAAGYAGGQGTTASFRYPLGVTLDSSNNILYVADTGSSRIRKIDLLTSMVTTIAGSSPSFQDGTGASAFFNHPLSLAFDSSASKLYVSDSYNYRIREVRPA